MKSYLILLFFTFSSLCSISQVNYTTNFNTAGNSDIWDNTGFVDDATNSCEGNSISDNCFGTGVSETVELYNTSSIGTNLGGDLSVSFDYKILDWNTSNGTVSGDIDYVKVFFSNSNTGPWVEVYDVGIHIQNDNCINKNFTFTPTAGETFLKFESKHNGGDYDIYFDNLTVVETTCSSPIVNYTLISDCNNSQFTIDVTVSDLGDATSVDITGGTTTFETNVGTGTFNIGPFAAGTDVSVTVDGSSYSGCSTTSASSYSEDCACTNTPSATVSSSNLNCIAGTYDINVTVDNFGDGTSADIYINNILVLASANLSQTYNFSGYPQGSNNISIDAQPYGSFVTCETSYSVSETCTPDICSDAIDILGNLTSIDLSTASNDASESDGTGEPSTLSFGSGNILSSCGGPTHSAYWYTDYTDVWLKVDIPDGSDEFTLEFTGLNCPIMVLPYTGSCGALSLMNIGNSGSGGIVDSDNDGNIEYENGNNPILLTDGAIHFRGAEVVSASTGTIYLRIIPHDDRTESDPCSLSLNYCSFDVIASSPQPNDTDGNAIDIEGVWSNGDLCLANTETESSENGDACADPQNGNDLWYQVSNNAGDPETLIEVQVQFENGTDAVVLSLFDGPYSNGWEECITLNSTGANSIVTYTFTTPMPTFQTEYYIRVTPVAGNAVCGFSITVNRVVENNNCELFGSFTSDYELNGGSEALFMEFASASNVDGVSGKDLWYKLYNINDQSVTITANSQTPSWDGEVSFIIYEYPSTASWDCSNPSIYCTIDNLDDFDLENGVTINFGTSSYILRIVETTTDPSGDDLHVTLTGVTSANSILPNSDCSNALDITSFDQTGNFTQTKLPCPSSSALYCGGSQYGSTPSDDFYGAELWYKFTVPGNTCYGTLSELSASNNIEEVTIQVDGMTNSSGTLTSKTAYLELWSDCNTLIQCGDEIANLGEVSNNSVTYSGLTSGFTYYLRVINNTSLSTSSSDFTVKALISAPPKPCNDDELNAVSYNLTQDISTNDCLNSASTYSAQGGDAWFKFVQPDNGSAYTNGLGFISIYMNFMNLGNSEIATVRLKNGAGNTLATGAFQTDDDEVRLHGINLTPGETYFVHITHTEDPTTNVQYNLCINGRNEQLDGCPDGFTNYENIGRECTNSCKLTYILDLPNETPSGYYKIWARHAESGKDVDVRLLYQSSVVDLGTDALAASSQDYDHPCSNKNGLVPIQSTGDLAADGTCAGTGEWITCNLIGASAGAKNYYYIEVEENSTDWPYCGGLDVCELYVKGPYSTDALAQAGGVPDVACSFTPLSVELIDFIGQNENRNNQLYWSTSSETNNSHFIVEKSLDGVNFKYVDQVAGNGTTSHQVNYSTTDYNIENQTIYYRLKQIDFDGTENISKTIAVNRANNSMELYPNPIKAGQSFIVSSDEFVNQYTITDIQGKVIEQRAFEKKKSVVISSQNLTSGIYFIRLNGETKSIQRLIVQ